MRVLIQRVLSARVEVEGKVCGEIGPGMLLFVGFGRDDTESLLPSAVKKIREMRLFSDANGKLNLSVEDTKGSLLAVSQFTLYANCSRGRRPDFTPAAPPDLAERLYDRFVEMLRETGIPVQTGIFAADMKVSLVNDGPVSFILDF
ncbi:MAG TPA: D-aminoacyl-tRNA deacylase [Candidatus Syntrophosphaera sp.]|jgi:D-tyrosyl-tRNA(Tyr) deacylase|nr:D-tyrosyl-tRNA(Tyr) deacylase [Candidatus Cloacimonadota bacterium]OQB92489.1 MAG: D-tyrosyl-tRNA(Tyr) deacylase [Candidatus Cloacimonetes bacterium ADurb.Bin117]HNU53715.1 D-aminoacyl-tRNA deacylase [Candidatus Syntrophosphaera sp.]HOH48545.1 D-aminoacyl-tRNA deacylase [Candidatus Syntrophosphaera sp.]HPB43268.1 D-aminoacyl-tRNA deacylase [Candidatus Syntrophosphaera sp.]